MTLRVVTRRHPTTWSSPATGPYTRLRARPRPSPSRPTDGPSSAHHLTRPHLRHLTQATAPSEPNDVPRSLPTARDHADGHPGDTGARAYGMSAGWTQRTPSSRSSLSLSCPAADSHAEVNVQPGEGEDGAVHDQSLQRGRAGDARCTSSATTSVVIVRRLLLTLTIRDAGDQQ